MYRAKFVMSKPMQKGDCRCIPGEWLITYVDTNGNNMNDVNLSKLKVKS